MSGSARLLHLIDPERRGGGPCVVRLLAGCMGDRDAAIVFGPEATVESARRAGVTPLRGLPVAAASGLTFTAVRRAVGRLERAGGRFDAVHAWTGGTIRAAIATHRPLGLTMTGSSAGRLALALAARRRPIDVVASGRDVAATARAAGLGTAVRVIPPAVEPESVSRADRTGVRRRWSIPEDAYAVGVLADPTDPSDAWEPACIALRAAVSGRAVTLILHPNARRRIEATRLTSAVGLEQLILTDERLAEPWRVAAGLDAALAWGGGAPGSASRVGSGPGVLPVLWAMAARIPVLMDAAHAAALDLDAERAVCVVDPHDTNRTCATLLSVLEHRDTADRLTDAARTRVVSRHTLAAYRRRFRDPYQGPV